MTNLSLFVLKNCGGLDRSNYLLPFLIHHPKVYGTRTIPPSSMLYIFILCANYKQEGERVYKKSESIRSGIALTKRRDVDHDAFTKLVTLRWSMVLHHLPYRFTSSTGSVRFLSSLTTTFQKVRTKAALIYPWCLIRYFFAKRYRNHAWLLNNLYNSHGFRSNKSDSDHESNKIDILLNTIIACNLASKYIYTPRAVHNRGNQITKSRE